MSAGATTLNDANADAWRPAVNPWIIAITVTLATFMEVLDTSIANVALPHIAGSLSAGQDESTWVLTSYLVSNAIVLPLSGWLSSIVGRKNFYMGCVALFTISSFLCGLAPNLAVLIICRVLQGAGGGGLQPSEQAILADTFAPAKRGMAFAVYGIAVVSAPAIGPTLGGWITDNFTWRWIFFINIPVGILSLLLTSRLIQDPPYLKRRKLSETKIDYIGLGFVALGLGTLQIVLDKGQRDDWFESHFIVILSVIAAASLIFVIFWEWRHKDPIIDLHLFRDRTFAVSNSLMFMLGFALLGSTLLAAAVHADPARLHRRAIGSRADARRLHHHALAAPGGIPALALQPALAADFRPGRAFRRRCSTWPVLTWTWISAPRLRLASFKPQAWRSCSFPSTPPPTRFCPGTRTTPRQDLMNLARNIGGSVGISLVTTMLDRRTQVHLNDLSHNLSASNPAFQQMLQGATQAMRAHGASAAFATQQAYALIENTVLRQATMLAYLDDFRLLGICHPGHGSPGVPHEKRQARRRNRGTLIRGKR